MREPSFDFLKRLLETPSPSGFETLGQRVWISYAEQFADRIESDSYGNVFAMFNSEGSPRILLAGHSDELGLMITHISEDGFLYFKGIGGVDRAMLRGRRVIVHGAAGPVPGVTGHLAIHMQEPDDRKKVPEFHEVFIDIGVGSRAEAGQLVRVGDAVTIDADVFKLTGDRIAARACDNRIGTWSAAEALRHLSGERERLSASVVAVSTIQEENGLYGATMAAYRVRPDAALVVDVTHATDIPICSKPKHGDVKLGGGPVISIGSANHPYSSNGCAGLRRRRRFRSSSRQTRASREPTLTQFSYSGAEFRRCASACRIDICTRLLKSLISPTSRLWLGSWLSFAWM